MFKRCEVVKLPTNEKATLKSDLAINENNLLFQPSKLEGTWFFLNKFQHLYILSDDKIEEGDWVYENNLNQETKIYQIIKREGKLLFFRFRSVPIWLENNNHGCKKIIATTDTSLSSIIHSNYPSGNTTGVRTLIEVPQIPQSFIDHYIQQYNKGNIITEVMVEYVDNWYIYIPSGKYHDDEPVKMKGNLGEGDYYLKVNPNNTINIKSLKDSWTREELVQILSEFGKDVVNKESHLPHMFELYAIDWIEQNL